MPPENVGGGTPVAQLSQPAGRNTAAPASRTESGYPPAPVTTGTIAPSYSAPAGESLDQQAQALAAGRGPMQPPPPIYGDGAGTQGTTTQRPRSSRGAPPQSLDQQAGRQPLQADTGTGQGQPQAAPAAAAASTGPTTAAPPVQQAALPRAGATQQGTIRFLPIIGAPIEAVTPLSRQLGAEARARGLTIKGATDPASDHILKGYLSAFSDNGKITVVYVWDVLDENGARLHRIQGQETVASSATDAWSAVPANVMQQIATRTIDEYTRWRAAGAG